MEENEMKSKTIDDEKVEFYAKKIPIHVRDAIKELSNDKKWAVYIALYLNHQMYFNQIKDEFQANPSTMTSLLRSLVDGGLIERKVQSLNDVFNNNKVFYEVSPFGKRLLTSVFEVSYPKPEPRLIEYVDGSSRNPIKIREYSAGRRVIGKHQMNRRSRDIYQENVYCQIQTGGRAYGK